MRLVNFNSIKVQLKLDAEGIAIPITKFQFHKGTIKTKIKLIFVTCN